MPSSGVITWTVTHRGTLVALSVAEPDPTAAPGGLAFASLCVEGLHQKGR